jgi:hypothetical protein
MEDMRKGVPQFATAEFAPDDPKLTCTGRIPKDTHAAFLRALLFGVAGAIAGFALYVIFALATGLIIGFVSLAGGFIVGKAMNFGSRGVGGQSPDAAATRGADTNIGKTLGVLALVGIASPFLDLGDPVHGVIGLVILFVGIRFAWRFTAGRTIDVTGPHTPIPSTAGVA